jgi:thiamine monophosphate synthase
MHRREHVHAIGSEDAGDLRNHAFGVRYEHQRVLMKDHIELAIAERAQVAHVGAQVVELRAAAPRKTADRIELSFRDVHEGRRRAELREEDRVPAAASGK